MVRQKIKHKWFIITNDVTDIIAIESPTINMQSTIELYKELESKKS
ncbi:MAG: hypothetical protein U0354_06885 [Candidatus Sericytochromatia bacterium]